MKNVLKSIHQVKFTDAQNKMFLKLSEQINQVCPEISPIEALKMVIDRYRTNFDATIRQERDTLKYKAKLGVLIETLYKRVTTV
jgi:hypothetical protein